MPWLFDNTNLVWHNYPQVPPQDGDLARCNHVKTDADKPTGGTDTPTRCQTCVAVLIVSGSQ
jgi:hypothetical protein